MIPIRDDNPTYHRSIATFAIIALNVVAWAFVQGLGFSPSLAKSICQFGLVPGELLGTVAPGTAIPLGRGLVCITESSPNWYTLVTSMFMHGGWFHILGNMWFLFIFGDNVEDAMGPVRFVAFYLLCGLAAAGAQMLSSPGSALPMVGASGAIGGVMGAYAVLYPRAPVHMLVFFGFFFTRIVVPAFLMLGYWFLLQLLGGFFPGQAGVAFWAHIGGFVAGIALLRLFCVSGRVDECRARRGRTDRIVRRYTKGRDIGDAEFYDVQ
jgi:membrane associated rhomboid family serine protease